METLSKHKTLSTLAVALCLKQASSSATFKLTGFSEGAAGSFEERLDALQSWKHCRSTKHCQHCPCLKQASSSATFKLTVAAGFFCVQKLDIGALQACSDLILAVGAVLARS